MIVFNEGLRSSTKVVICSFEDIVDSSLYTAHPLVSFKTLTIQTFLISVKCINSCHPLQTKRRHIIFATIEEIGAT